MSDPAQLETHRVALTGHCYRMLGSASDADDAVQETLVRAWKSLDRFDGRSSMKTWLYRIATNVCLDQLSERKRRERPIEGPMGTIYDSLETRERAHWLEPIADARAIPAEADPAERAMLRQSIRLAFVAALQHLSPKERAALLLAEVLGFSAAEIADTLETSVASVNSALQRARANLPERDLEALQAASDEVPSHLIDRYVDAFERYDMEALTKLLHEDAVLSMPPFTLWLQGPDTIANWMLGRGMGCMGSKLIRVEAAGSPAFAQYKGDGTPWALIVLDVAGGRIGSLTFFLDTKALVPQLALPEQYFG